MKPQVAFLVFFILLSSSVLAGIDSMLRAGQQAQLNVDRALTLTLAQCDMDHVGTDTIQVYRSHITMNELRDTAYLSIVSDQGNGEQARVVAHTGLTIDRLWGISDQRASGVLAALSALWLLFTLGTLQNKQVEQVPEPVAVETSVAHFTPMQQQLMDMFMEAPGHRLSQRDICDRLWPKKPDASATLYTLIRRIKPILEEKCGASIKCHRGDAYQLVFNHETI